MLREFVNRKGKRIITSLRGFVKHQCNKKIVCPSFPLQNEVEKISGMSYNVLHAE